MTSQSAISFKCDQGEVVHVFIRTYVDIEDNDDNNERINHDNSFGNTIGDESMGYDNDNVGDDQKNDKKQSNKKSNKKTKSNNKNNKMENVHNKLDGKPFSETSITMVLPYISQSFYLFRFY